MFQSLYQPSDEGSPKNSNVTRRRLRFANNNGEGTAGKISHVHAFAGYCFSCLSNVFFQPIIKLLKIKLPVYVIFLGTLCFVMMSQVAIMYSNHSIFLKLDDVMDAIHPINSILMNSTQIRPDDNRAISTAMKNEMTDDAVSEDASNPYNVGAKDGVFFSNVSYDFRECTSPESHVPWPLEGDIQSKTSAITCGMSADTPFSRFFSSQLWKTKFEPLIKQCNKLVVFGVAFGGNFVKDLDAPHVQKLVNATDLERRHGRCFFILTTENDVVRNQHIVDKYNGKDRSFIDPIAVGHNTLVPIPDDILPYKNPRRNVKLLKYVGQYLFQNAETVIWQDAKFFRDDFVSKQPMNYLDLTDDDSCVTAMALPVHKITVGLENIRNGMQKHGRYRAQYEHHCMTIIAALSDRPNVTDSSDNLIRQCDAYLQHVYQEKGNIETMNQGLVDSAFIVWNHKTQVCRDFSSAFRCTIVDQIQCHSDRDQVGIPFAMYKMGVAGMYRQHTGGKLKTVDEKWDPRIHDLEFIVTEEDKAKTNHSLAVTGNDGNDEEPPTMIRVTRSSCHWYFSRLGNCRTDLTDEKPTIALLVAGSAKRFVLDGLTEHFIKPLVEEQNTKVDYYLMLSVKQGLAYRSNDAYMKYQTFDPAFGEIRNEKNTDVVTAFLFDKIRKMISLSGANVGGIHIQPQPMRLDHPKLRRKQLEAKKVRPKEDSYFRFPTLDLRPEFRRRTAVTNRNLFKLYLGIHKLWDKHLISSETYIGVSYDYVMILREDVMWLGDFNLEKLIATNPQADAYVVSCDIRHQKDSQIIENEYSDYGIVIKREKATLLGKYFTHILRTDLNACHESVKDMVPPDTGCNSGMLLYWIMKEHDVKVQRVAQSVFPIERAFNLNFNQTTQRCIHRYCQSKEAPLQIPDDLPICSNLELQ